MRTIALVLSCMACAGAQRRVDESDPSKVLAELLLASNPTVGWQGTGFGRVPTAAATHRQRPTLPTMPRSSNIVSFFGTKEKEAVKEGTEETEAEEELPESKKMMQQVKDAGIAGIISYIFWEWAFWGASVPFGIYTYYGLTGHFPDFSDPEDQKQLAGEAFAFVNVARFAVPARISAALATTPWVKENVVEKFGLEKEEEEAEQA